MHQHKPTPDLFTELIPVPINFCQWVTHYFLWNKENHNPPARLFAYCFQFYALVRLWGLGKTIFLLNSNKVKKKV